jgi:hypothetical protein
MRIHQDAMVQFSPPGRTHGVPIEPLEVHSPTHFLPGTLVPAIGKGGTNLSSRLQCNGPTRNAPAADRLPDLTEPEEIACWACDLGGETVASRSQL